MKYKVSKNLKITISSILLVLILANSFFLFRQVSKNSYAAEDRQGSNYTYTSNIDYQVNLIPNDIYETRTLGEDKKYIEELVDSIDINFSYDYRTNSEAEGNYSILAIVEGYIVTSDEHETIWEREFPIISNESINTSDGQLLIQENVRIELDEYKEFLSEALESTGVSFQSNLTLMLDVDLDGSTSDSPRLVIPLNESLFEITSHQVESPGIRAAVAENQGLTNRTPIFIYGGIIALSIIGLVFTTFFTQGERENDPFIMEINRIFKKHGDRLVALSSQVDFKDAIRLISMEDLVRLADELNRPILYEYSKDPKEINKFFITVNDEIYVFEIEDSLKGETYASVN